MPVVSTKLRRSVLRLLCLVCAGDAAMSVAQNTIEPVYDIWLSNRFEYESDATGSDSDFRPYLSLHGRGFLDGHLDMRLSGAAELDLNEDDPIDNAYEGSWPRVHEALIDVHDYGALSHLVLGRQYLPRIDDLRFDGLSLSLWEPRKLSFFAFGGRPVSHYSSNAGESLAGAGVHARLLPSTAVQVDGYNIDDAGRDVFASAVRLSQYFPCGFGDTLEARWIEDAFRDFEGRLYYHGSDRYDISSLVYWQANQLGNDSNTRESRYFSAYSDFMRTAEEHLLFSVDANRYLGEHYTLSVGAGRRYILDRDKKGGQNFTNIDSTRFSAGLNVTDLPAAGFTFDLYASQISHPDESFWDLNGEVGYTFTPKFGASCGVSRAQYDFSDELFFKDRFGFPVPDETGGRHVGDLVFLEMRYKPSARWRVVVRTGYEDVDELSEDAYSVSLRVDYHFRTPKRK